MKIVFFALLTLLLVSCRQTNIDKNEKELDYDIIENRLISWDEIFMEEEERYLTYVFSETCGYCASIKEDVIKFYLKDIESMYFVKNPDKDKYFSSSIKSLIGISSPNDLKIYGVPCLLEIEKHAILNYHYGKTDILNFLIV